MIFNLRILLNLIIVTNATKVVREAKVRRTTIVYLYRNSEYYMYFIHRRLDLYTCPLQCLLDEVLY